MNKAIPLVVFLMLTAVTSCTSSTESARFKSLSISFGEDGEIDEKEMNELIDFVKETKGETFKSLKNGNEIKRDELCNQLLKILRRKNITITKESVFGMTHEDPVSPFKINVFLENSMSMDGYLDGKTNFETALFSLLSDLKATDLTQQMSLNYINSEIIEIDSMANDQSIDRFINNLEPKEFKRKGGNRGTTELAGVINRTLQKVDSKSVSLFISDCIFSPGRDREASSYLDAQKIKLKSHFHNKLDDNPDLCALVIRLESNFNGLYFDQRDSPKHLTSIRPYFIWVMATKQNMKSLIDSKILDNIEGGYSQRYLMYGRNLETHKPDFAIRRKGKIGNFRLEDYNKKIRKAELSVAKKSKGKFGFQFNTNLKYPFLSSSVLEDSSNYILSDPNYKISIRKTDPHDRQAVGYSHTIAVETNKLNDETLKIEMYYAPNIPDWVLESSCEEDRNLATGSLQSKTFGLSQLFQGVFNGFNPPTENPARILSFAIPITQ